jgi:flagellar motility protein MotE (MotC chaperone)
VVDHETVVRLRERHPSWRLLRADNGPLVLAFLGRWFVVDNHGATTATELVSALDDVLFALVGPDGQARYSRSAADYLDDWAATERGWLRRFYPVGSDEVHYDATPAFEKAYAWVDGLQARAFVGTESRLATVVDLLRQIVHGTETDPQTRLAELHRRRDEIDQEIAQVESGTVTVLDDTGVRDRYQQMASTARALLADFREVEENFRALDRAAREQIASWVGSKGELLERLVTDRADIATSDQGRSFQAFYDVLLSEARLDELSDLLTRVGRLDVVDPDHRLESIHHDWSEAAGRTQQTVRQLSEQLRRFLDEKTWLENRRVLELVHTVESAALACRDAPPQDAGLTIDRPGVPIALPFERPLYDARPTVQVDSSLTVGDDLEADVAALLDQTFVNLARLADNVRAVVPRGGAVALDDVVMMYPVEQGVSEVVGYLALTDDDIDVTWDEADQTVVEYPTDAGPRRAHLPRVTLSRR